MLLPVWPGAGSAGHCGTYIEPFRLIKVGGFAAEDFPQGENGKGWHEVLWGTTCLEILIPTSLKLYLKPHWECFLDWEICELIGFPWLLLCAHATLGLKWLGLFASGGVDKFRGTAAKALPRIACFHSILISHTISVSCGIISYPSANSLRIVPSLGARKKYPYCEDFFFCEELRNFPAFSLFRNTVPECG